MIVTPEELMSYADGELSGEDKARVEAAIAADHALARQLAAEQSLRAQLSAHFAPVAKEPVPADWLNMIAAASAVPAPPQASAEIVNLAEARAVRERPAPRWQVPVWGTGLAMAASLALGLMIGKPGSNDGPVNLKGGALIADGALANALDHQLADASETATPYRVFASFTKQGGGYCRVFSGAEVSGIACHEGKDWRVQHLIPGTAPQAGAYRQAGSESGELMRLAQNLAEGEPLDPAQEKAARDGGW